MSNKCQQCGSSTDNPRFCGRSCAAKFNNKKPKRKRNKVNCKKCAKDITHYDKVRTVCDECHAAKPVEPTEITCSKCKETKPTSEFYKRSGRPGQYQSYCKPCLLYAQSKRWVDRKIKAIEHMGGKCIDCGYTGHRAAFQFHHLDPTTKDVDWNKLRLRSWDKIKLELDKCVLLCANCHSIRHSKDYD